jgi:UDP-N-acetylglucosamine--N-acetylmuramyl-(pentapeptide) pyrophosphoryl-undecaprenol N-acetylglucosamine transferase
MTLNSKQIIALAAGGTGGHLFPAQALAEVLSARGYEIHLITDERVRDYGKSFPATQTHIVPSASLSLSKLTAVPGNFWRLFSGKCCTWACQQIAGVTGECNCHVV